MPGFAGFYCERSVNICINSPCMNGGICMEIAPNVFNCSCPNGYTGTFCEKKITYYLGYDITDMTLKSDRMTNSLNPCLSRPCLNEGVCLLKSIGYSCICGLQYTGTNCQYLVNHCEKNPCLNGKF